MSEIDIFIQTPDENMFLHHRLLMCHLLGSCP